MTVGARALRSELAKHAPHWEDSRPREGAEPSFVPCECGEKISPASWETFYDHFTQAVLSRISQDAGTDA